MPRSQTGKRHLSESCSKECITLPPTINAIYCDFLKYKNDNFLHQYIAFTFSNNLFYKVVEGLVLPIPPEEFLQPTRQKRQIRAKTYTNFVKSNIIDSQVTNNNRSSKVNQCKTEPYRNSFFVRTAIQWNYLENLDVHAETVEGFKSALHKCY